MHFHIIVCWTFLCILLPVSGRRDLFDTKCTRECNTVEGSLACWTATTDGFAYGLSTAMIDFCQVILKVRELANETESWYNISRNILMKQIENYELEEVRQLKKSDIEAIAISLLNKCYNASSLINSFEPPCPSCTNEQNKLIKQWQVSSIVIYSIGLFLVIIVLLLYFLYTYYVRRSYVTI
ncbi:hypothetical protein I4U23_008137 [Adineta vaga]|nr:hypothetical protein I4U23_008137 [Adineta vaga]